MQNTTKTLFVSKYVNNGPAWQIQALTLKGNKRIYTLSPVDYKLRKEFTFDIVEEAFIEHYKPLEEPSDEET